MSSHYERALSTEQSLSIAEQAIFDLNLRANDESHGVDLKTYRCKLIDDQHQSIFYGFGKGLGLQSKVSAYYEALEHYTLHQFAQAVASNQDNYIAMDNYEHKLPCVDSIDIHSNEKMAYPIFMLDPRYPKRKSKNDKMNYLPYAWRADESGLASGTNVTEASIHALNELVERDAHSLFLIDAFIKNKNQQIRLIDKSTLPSNLKAIVKTIEYQYNDDLMLFDIRSEIDIPVMYVSMTKQPFLIQPAGRGASLNPEYALERALLEALQPVHIHNEKLVDNQQQIIKELSNLPLLLKAAIGDVTTLQDKCQQVDFKSVPGHNVNLTLTEQLQSILKKIEITEARIFKIPIINLPSGFTCVKFLIPDFEQFHLVQTGKRILPNKRGMQWLNNNMRSIY